MKKKVFHSQSKDDSPKDPKWEGGIAVWLESRISWVPWRRTGAMLSNLRGLRALYFWWFGASQQSGLATILRMSTSQSVLYREKDRRLCQEIWG